VGCWWPNAAIDAGRGLWIPDLSGQGRIAGLTNGGTWQAGSAGEWALGLNMGAETNQYLGVTWPSDYDPQEFTIVTRTNLVSTSRGAIIASGDVAWYIQTGKGYFRVDKGGYIIISGGFAAGEWQHHVMAVSTTDAQWYINGDLNNTNTKATTPKWGASIIWGRIDNDYRLQGCTDHVMLYERKLSPEEIAWLYREPAAMIWVPGRKRLFYVEDNPLFRLRPQGATVRMGPKLIRIM
jgi:hypothetical protein